ncbi:MAG: diphthamide biosynthesis enzyme Dph2, partial [Candidatus Bathyarchaeota archaeon]
NAEILLSGDSCYGACDLAQGQAETLGADMIIHYGHSNMLGETAIPVLYVDARVDFEARSLAEKALPLMGDWERIGLTATLQHAHKLEEVSEALQRSGLRTIIGSGSSRTSHDGQILGCDYTSAQSISDRVDGFLFIGAGRFHPLGLAATTGKPVIIADPYSMRAEKLDEKEVTRLAMRRMAAITAAREAKRIGILVSTKPGQLQMATARTLQRKISRRGGKTAIICLDEITPLKLGNFTESEAYINTACPRMALDGLPEIEKPLLTTTEAQVMLGERRWEEVWGHSYFE